MREKVNEDSQEWLAIVIGNSRLHWGYFANATLQQTWDTPHLSPTTSPDDLLNVRGFPSKVAHSPMAQRLRSLPIWMASVVPAQTVFWHQMPQVQILTLDHIPLLGLYPTLGIDRALALWGAAQTQGFPVLVIDAGTALTFTGADATGQLLGGAILPGLGLQLRSLTTQTAALPTVALTNMPSSLTRWATTTSESMLSGVIYSLLATLRDFIADWQQQFPQSATVLTGGDAAVLWQQWQIHKLTIAYPITVDPHVIFWGMQAIVESLE